MDVKYPTGSIITHYKGNTYVVLMTPAAGLVMEADGSEAYMYASITDKGDLGDQKWLRSRHEVEDDKRFVLSTSFVISDNFRRALLKESFRIVFD